MDNLINDIRNVFNNSGSNNQPILKQGKQFIRYTDDYVNVVTPELKIIQQTTSPQLKSIVETLGAAIWFTEADVLGIIESVVDNRTQHIPAHVRFMPAEYKPVWNKMNESEKNRIHAKSQLYALNTPYQVKSFWDEQDLRGISERVELEKNNAKMQKLNESQGTEGMISVDRVVEHQRGYTSNYLDTLMRGAQYRK